MNKVTALIPSALSTHPTEVHSGVLSNGTWLLPPVSLPHHLFPAVNLQHPSLPLPGPLSVPSSIQLPAYFLRTQTNLVMSLG